MRLAARCTVAALLLAAVAASAEETRTPPAVAFSRLFFPQERYEEIVAAASQSIAAQISEGVQREGGTVSPDFEERVRVAYRKLMPYDELADFQAGLIAKYYTEEELQQVAAFYRSPVGQKALRLMPEMVKDVMGLLQVSLQKRMPAMFESLRPYIHAPEKKDRAAKP